MSAIISNEYREARAAFAADPIFNVLLTEVVYIQRNSLDSIQHAEGEPRIEFSRAVYAEYQRRGGEVKAHGIGDPGHALLGLVHQEIGRLRHVRGLLVDLGKDENVARVDEVLADLGVSA